MIRLVTLLIVFGISMSSSASVSKNIPADDSSSDKTSRPLPYKSKIISRGQLLYENHCLVCHTSVVHIRDKRKAASLGAISNWVVRWSAELKLNWTADEINDVASYLNQRYYQFTE